MLNARPMPVSSSPPHQTGMPCFAARSCILMLSTRPPTLPGLILIILQAPSCIALRASSALSMLSSRQIGVCIPFVVSRDR